MSSDLYWLTLGYGLTHQQVIAQGHITPNGQRALSARFKDMGLAVEVIWMDGHETLLCETVEKVKARRIYRTLLDKGWKNAA